MNYDIIGDIHGHAHALISLLKRLGYEEHGGVYAHPGNRAIFVGDFVDRGPEIRETLAIVRRMVDTGSAMSVMGNHEYNALCFHRERVVDGDPIKHSWLRSRVDRHLYQHIETLHQFRDHRSEWYGYLDWFASLPLFLDLGPLRVVHAAWHTTSIELLRSRTADGNRLTDELLFAATRRGNPEFDAIQNVLKGVELSLPSTATFIDKDGNERTEMRVRWWVDARGMTYREIAMPSRPEVEDIPISEGDLELLSTYDDRIPVFFGHYWLTDSTPSILTAYAACLDYSIAKDGYLAAYRWRGETELTNDHFVIHY